MPRQVASVAIWLKSADQRLEIAILQCLPSSGTEAICAGKERASLRLIATWRVEDTTCRRCEAAADKSAEYQFEYQVVVFVFVESDFTGGFYNTVAIEAVIPSNYLIVLIWLELELSRRQIRFKVSAQVSDPQVRLGAAPGSTSSKTR